MRARLLALLLGLALAAVAALGLRAAWRARGEPAPVSAAGSVEAVRELLALRALAGPLVPAGRFDLVREPIPPDVAARLFPVLTLSGVGNEYDPHTYWRLRGNLERRIPYEGHPAGAWTFRTNAEGLREDADLPSARPGLLVLVAGDSHTEGYCENSESWPNRLEARLREARPGRTVEVLNAGKSGYSFYNLLGTLERFLHLRPDVFVMTVYGGNDFAESLTLHHYFRRTLPRACPDCDRDRMYLRSPHRTVGLYLQALRQVVLLRDHPEERAAALEAGVSVTLAAARLAREAGVRLVVAYLPSVVEVQPAVAGEFLPDAREVFALTDEDLRANDLLADEWLAHVREAGIECLDLRPALASDPEPAYTALDNHLNLEGNRVVAEALLERLRE